MFNCIFGSVTRSGRLFVVGNEKLIDSTYDKRRFSFAGSRRGVSGSSRNWVREQVSKLDPNQHVLVSGGAIGVDSLAHRTALKRGIPQVVVLPSGFNVPYPRSNLGLFKSIVKSGGCLVSLLPPDSRANHSSFIERNQVIAQLGASLLVPQCASASGTMHTVRFALSAKVPVFFHRNGASHLVGVMGCSPL